MQHSLHPKMRSITKPETDSVLDIIFQSIKQTVSERRMEESKGRMDTIKGGSKDTSKDGRKEGRMKESKTGRKEASKQDKKEASKEGTNKESSKEGRK